MAMPWVLLVGCAIPYGGVTVEVPASSRSYPDGQCGVAAAEAILAFWKLPFTHDRVVRDLYVPAVEGTPPDLLAWFLDRHGLSAPAGRGDIPLLGRSLRDGAPPVCFLGGGAATERGHFLVVTGLTRDQARVRVLSEGRSHWQRTSEFTNRWERGHFTVLLPRPKESMAGDTSRRVSAPMPSPGGQP